MKKLTYAILSLALFFFLAGCDQFALPQVTENQTTSQDLLVNEDGFLNANELALQAVSVNSLVIPFLAQSDMNLLNFSLLADTTEDPLVNSTVDDLDRYLDLLNQLLASSSGLTVTSVVSDRPEFSFELTFSVVTLLGEAQSYVLYYNEIVPVEDPATTDDTTTTEDPVTVDPATDEGSELLGYHQDRPFNFPCTDDDAEVVSVQIQGLLVSGDVETTLEGALIQKDTVQVLRLYAYLDDANYVKVNVQTDSSDLSKKFFYQVVSGGIVVSESKIKVSTDEDGVKINLEIIEGTTSINFTANQETVGGVTSIRIRYQIIDNEVILETGNVIIIKTIDELTGEDVYEYTVLPEGFGNGYKFHSDNGHHGCGEGVPFNNQQGDSNQEPGGSKDGSTHGHHGGGHHAQDSTVPTEDPVTDEPVVNSTPPTDSTL